MTTAQHSIGSGFGAHSTAAEVLTEIDLTGTLAIVTGGYSGIGLETTRALADAGAHVVVPARRQTTAAQVLYGLDNAQVDELDLADLDSVGAFAHRFLAAERRIDILINSAGIMACPSATVGPGWEAQLGTNHLGHYALLNQLWPAFNEGARVVSVSSRGHHRSDIRWDDPHFARDEYDKWLAYGQSKTANVLFARQVDVLAQQRGVRAFSLHPGAILTPLQRHMSLSEQVERGWRHTDGTPTENSEFKTTAQGAATQVWAATSPQLNGLGGVYLEDCDIADITGSDVTTHGVRDYAVDPGSAQRLWELSASMTHLDSLS